MPIGVCSRDLESSKMRQNWWLFNWYIRRLAHRRLKSRLSLEPGYSYGMHTDTLCMFTNTLVREVSHDDDIPHFQGCNALNKTNPGHCNCGVRSLSEKKPFQFLLTRVLWVLETKMELVREFLKFQHHQHQQDKEFREYYGGSSSWGELLLQMRLRDDGLAFYRGESSYTQLGEADLKGERLVIDALESLSQKD